MGRTLLACLWLALTPTASAQTALAPITPDEVAKLRGDIRQLDEQIREKRARAEQNLAARNAACYKKVLVSACLESSRREDVAARVDIRKLETEVRRIEREIRLREDVTRKAAAEAAAPQKAEEEAAAAAKNLEESKQREAEFQRREAEHGKRAEEGKVRAAREAQDRAKRDAEIREQQRKKEDAARERAAQMPPPATSSTKPYTPPAIDLPAAPSSIAPRR